MSAPAAYPPPGAWGLTLASPRRRWSARAARTARAAAAALTTVAVGALTAAGVLLAGSGPAHADILGVSDGVQDWLCGIVAPSEPWESVGDGPESWMSNRNLAGARQIPSYTVTADGSAYTPIAAVTGGRVPDTMDQLPALPPGDYTLYEVAGLRGLSWWTIPLNVDGTRNCDLWAYVWTQAGNLLQTVNVTVLQVVIAVKEAAAADRPLQFLYDEGGGAVATAFSLFFVPVATLMVIVAGLWIGVNALRRRGIRAALGGAAIAACVLALTGFVYSVVDNNGTTGFRVVAGVADTAISQINAVATAALLGNLAQDTGPCALPSTGGVDPARGQRITSCVMADTLGYRPWAVGQFGGAGARPIPLPSDWTPVPAAAITPETLRDPKTLPCYVPVGQCRDLRTYLIAQHGGLQLGDSLSGPNGYVRCTGTAEQAFTDAHPEWLQVKQTAAEAGIPTTAMTLLVGSACSPMYRVFRVLADTDPAAAQAYAGGVGIARVSQGFAAIVGTLVAGIAVLVTGLITMMWHALTFALWITGIFKLAFATYPGKSKLAREWAFDVVHAWAARLAYGILLTITILVIGWMLAAEMSFGLRLVWLGLILVLFWKLVRKVQDLIRPAQGSMGQQMAGGVQQHTSAVARRTGRLTRRGVTGAGLGVAGAVDRRRALAHDPTRGPMRRTIGSLITPVAVLAGGVRGAVTGPDGAQRRAIRDLSRATRHPPNPVTAAGASTTPTIPAAAPPRLAGTAHPAALPSRAVGGAPIRRPAPPAAPAAPAAQTTAAPAPTAPPRPTAPSQLPVHHPRRDSGPLSPWRRPGPPPGLDTTVIPVHAVADQPGAHAQALEPVP